MNAIYSVARYQIGPILGAFASAYIFTWGVTCLGIVALVLVGASFHAAETGMLLAAFPIMLSAFLWSFITRKTGRACALLVGSGAAMTLAAWALQSQLLN